MAARERSNFYIHRGLLIAFDGTDSSGKATQALALVGRLRHLGHVVHHFETPDYTTPTGKELKARLQNRQGTWGETPWEEKMKLFAANRAEHRADVLQALERGEIVVYDRYVPSSLAFIAIEALSAPVADLWREKIQAVVARHEYVERGMPREDTSIFLDVPPVVSDALLGARKERRRDDHEYTDHVALQQRLYNEYDILCHSEPKRFLRIACVVAGELLPMDDVTELVWEALRHRFPVFAQPYGA